MECARFHVDTGPSPLFQRVHQVFDGPRPLNLHGPHLAERARQHAAPVAVLEFFDPHVWELMLVEVRTDTGKFVSTTWRRRIRGRDWWLVIGFHDTVRTFYPAEPGKRGRGADVVTEGLLWSRVCEVNKQLVDRHRA